jgi:hypothetical protein
VRELGLLAKVVDYRLLALTARAAPFHARHVPTIVGSFGAGKQHSRSTRKGQLVEESFICAEAVLLYAAPVSHSVPPIVNESS